MRRERASGRFPGGIRRALDSRGARRRRARPPREGPRSGWAGRRRALRPRAARRARARRARRSRRRRRRRRFGGGSRSRDRRRISRDDARARGAWEAREAARASRLAAYAARRAASDAATEISSESSSRVRTSAEAYENEAIMHELLVDPEWRLPANENAFSANAAPGVDAVDADALGARVREAMTRAFWDATRDALLEKDVRRAAGVVAELGDALASLCPEHRRSEAEAALLLRLTPTAAAAALARVADDPGALGDAFAEVTREASRMLARLGALARATRAPRAMPRLWNAGSARSPPRRRLFLPAETRSARCASPRTPSRTRCASSSPRSRVSAGTSRTSRSRAWRRWRAATSGASPRDRRGMGRSAGAARRRRSGRRSRRRRRATPRVSRRRCRARARGSRRRQARRTRWTRRFHRWRSRQGILRTRHRRHRRARRTRVVSRSRCVRGTRSARRAAKTRVPARSGSRRLRLEIPLRSPFVRRAPPPTRVCCASRSSIS